MTDYVNIYDASAHQDFYIQHDKAVAAGFPAAIFRASTGTLKDGTFAYNADRTLAADGRIGAYHFYYVHRPAREQAEVFWAQIEPYWPLSVKAWWDIEGFSNLVAKWPAHAVEAHVLEADDRFQQLAGQTWDGIYTSASKWQEVLADRLSGAFSWLLGVAHYTTRPEPFLPAPWRNAGKPWWWWQFSAYGRVSWYRDGFYNLDLGRIRRSDFEAEEPPPQPEPTIEEKVDRLWLAHPELHSVI